VAFRELAGTLPGYGGGLHGDHDLVDEQVLGLYDDELDHVQARRHQDPKPVRPQGRDHGTISGVC
jgi:hypothetical protein